MKCDKCESKRVLDVSAKPSDCCGVTLNGVTHEGYLPKDLGIGGGDYVEFRLCLECGKVQGKFPLAECALEQTDSNEYIVDFYSNHFVEGSLVNYSRLDSRRLVESASYLSPKFRNFLSEFLENNSGFVSGKRMRMPSANIFLNMYLNNDCYVSE